MLKEFKEFIAKGNVMDMAVGLVMGSAFTAIVNSLVADIITPLIGILLGGIDFSGWIVTVGSAELLVGNFINTIISFLLIALVLFFIIKFLNKLKREEEVEEAVEEAVPSNEEVLLTEIRDLLKDK